MPQLFPLSPVLVRSARQTLVLACAGLALGAASASAADGGGAEAVDPAAAPDPAAEPAATPAPETAPAPAPASSAVAAPSRAVIRSVQRKLHVKADGVYGPRTRAVVKRFQQRKRLTANGRLNAETLEALGVRARAASVPTAPIPAETTELLEAIADCESGGDPTSVSASGAHRGKYQFLIPTWEAQGGVGDPAEAPEAEQDQRAAALLATEGIKPWPVCGKQAQAALASAS